MKHPSILLPIIAMAGLSSCASSPELMDTATKVVQQVATQNGGGGALTQSEIVAGLKEALTIGSEHVVSQLGTTDGFNADPKVHIPLPSQLQKAKDVASKFGLDRGFNNLETKLNRAAEAATPKAKALFVDAISQMTLDDARGILKGPDDAATRYFQSKMSTPLAAEMKPIVSNAMAQVGAVQAYDQVINSLGPIKSMVPDVQADLTSYVVGKAMDGVFVYLAQEEAAIRKDPLKRTTDLLRKVFQ
ncbi:MAG: DUF4197 domain-containing protein [Thiotrichales bacterium]